MNTKRLKVGVLADSLRLTGEAMIRKAAELGAEGIQLYVTRGVYDGTVMTPKDIRSLKQMTESLGLEISALCGDLGQGFLNAETSPEVIRKTNQYLDLANALEVRVVTSHVGWMSHDPQADDYKRGMESMHAVGSHAEKAGVFFASETGAESADQLKAFIEAVDSPWIRVNFDPANFILGEKDDPIRAFRILAPYVVHTHAKDASGKGMEAAIGQGQVPFPALVKVYAECGYSGFLTIERESGDDPEGDIRKSIAYLKQIVA